MPVQKTLENKNSKPREGYLIDYVRGAEVKATPEEVEAVQPFSKKLVEDLRYSKRQIQTRPQYTIKNGTQRIGLIDIAVFENGKKIR